MTRGLILVAFIFLLAACGPQATPFPAEVPTNTPAALQSGASTPIRYALAANTQGLVGDLGAIQTSSRMDQLTDPINPDDLGSRYDIVVAYGDIPNGSRSPLIPHIALIVKTDDLPLNNPALLSILKRSLDPQMMLTALNIPGAQADSMESEEPGKLRIELANAGLPDGFALNMAYAYTPGVSQLVVQFQAAGIRVQPLLINKSEINTTLDQNRVQLALVAWTTPQERTSWTTHFGDDHVIDLYSTPISYRAVPELKITFTYDGWPLASR